MKRILNKHFYVEMLAVLICVLLLVLYFFLIVPFPVKRENISLKIQYANKTYEYDGLMTGGDYLNEVLNEYNNWYDLGFKCDESRHAWGTVVKGFKGSPQTDPYDYNKMDYDDKRYLFFVNGEMCQTVISGVEIKAGDEIVIRYVTNIIYNEDGTIRTYNLAEGGDSSPLTKDMDKYEFIFIVFEVIIAILIVGAIIFTIIDYKRCGTIAASEEKKKSQE